jgi:hypothetical protein
MTFACENRACRVNLFEDATPAPGLAGLEAALRGDKCPACDQYGSVAS